MLCSAVFAFLAFTQPDRDQYVGMISIRLIYYMFVLLLLWLAASDIKASFTVPLVIIYFSVFYWLFGNTYRSIRYLNERIKDFEEVMKKVKDSTLVAQAYFAGDYLWQGHHFIDYFGASRPLLILDNYEAGVTHFPVQWNRERMPKLMLGSVTRDKYCFWLESGEINHRIKRIDYVLVVGEKPRDSCYVQTLRLLSNDYRLICGSGGINLYVLKETE